MYPESDNNRNPRIDPHPGDVVRVGPPYNHDYFEVLDHDPRYPSTDVCFWDATKGQECVWSISQWREAMKHAEVLILCPYTKR